LFGLLLKTELINDASLQGSPSFMVQVSGIGLPPMRMIYAISLRLFAHLRPGHGKTKQRSEA
jgi:hypothetical protein